MNTEETSGSPIGPFKSEQHRNLQKKIDVFFGILVALIVTVGMGVVGYIFSEESIVVAALASATTALLLSLGIVAAARGYFWGVYGITTVIVCGLSVHSVLTRGQSFTVYFIAFNAMISFGVGGRVYAAIIAKWRAFADDAAQLRAEGGMRNSSSG